MSLLLAAEGQPQRLSLWKPVALIALGFFAVDEDSAAKQQSLHAYRSAAAAAGTGTTPHPVNQMVLVEQERDAVRTDHNQRLLFGRPAVAGPGQPWHLWKPQVRHTAPEDYIVLNVGDAYSPAALTPAGQPWHLWPAAKANQPEAEPDAVRTDHASRLFFGRTSVAAAAPGQPWHLWRPQVRHTAPEEYLVLNVGDAYSQAGTAPVVAPGQPWHLWKPQVRHTAPEEYLVINQGAAYSPAAITPAVPVGAPWYLWKPQVRHTDPEEYTVPPPSLFALTRVTVGQQWYVYQPVVASQEIEPQPQTTNHNARLLFGRAAAAAPVGQPWHLWKPQVRQTAAEDYLVINQGAAYSPAALTPFVAAGAPWYLWKPQVRHTEPEDYRAPAPSAFALTRVTVGQQWYVYQPAVASQDVEPNPPPTDHAAALNHLRPHQAVTPPVAAPPPPPTVVPAGRKRDRYIARYKGKEYDLDSLAELERFIARAKAEQNSKPKAERAPVRIVLTPSFADEIRPFVMPPTRMWAMPPSVALAQARKIEHIYKRAIVQEYDEDDDMEALLWLM